MGTILKSNSENRALEVVSHVNNSVDNILRDNRIPKETESTLFHPNPDIGMSGRAGRLLFNRLCSTVGTSYLEAGTAGGSMFCSAAHKNDHTKNQFVGFDLFHDKVISNCRINFTEMFSKNFKEYVGNPAEMHGVYHALKGNYFEIDLVDFFERRNLQKVNFYFYDADHTFEATYYSLIHTIDVLDEVFIYAVDDWNDCNIRKGAFNSIKDLGLKIHGYWPLHSLSGDMWLNVPKEIRLKDYEKWFGDYTRFYNGIGVFVLEKNDKSFFEIAKKRNLNYLSMKNIPEFAWSDPILVNLSSLNLVPGIVLDWHRQNIRSTQEVQIKDII